MHQQDQYQRDRQDQQADDIGYASAGAIAAAVAAGELSSREVVTHLLRRIERLDGPVNAVVTVDAERAWEAASAADDAVARGDELGPLHGVPITLKDSWATAGLTTTSGAPELRDHVPEHDAAPVAALRRAGAVVLGKTNLPIYAGDHQSYNDVFGTTNNPYDATRTCGGSSGGAAAALASGFTPLELGSDIGGSIRGPAHWNGVVGHKPSFGVVPTHGHIPGPPGALSVPDLAVGGPMARTVEDCELALDLIAGPDRWNEAGWRLQLPPPKRTALADYRITVWADDPSCPVGAEVRGLVEQAAQRLADAGATVDADARPQLGFDTAQSTFVALLSSALSVEHSPDRLEQWAALDGDGEADRVRRLTAMRHRDWLVHHEDRQQHRQRWAELFSTWDVALLPVMPVAAIPHDHSKPLAARTIDVDGEVRPYNDLLRWMGIVGASLLPATVVPVGLTSTGLPVGVQVVAPYLHDRTALDVARHVLEQAGGCPRPPGF